MPNKKRLKKILSKLSELENSLPGGEVLSMVEKIIQEKYNDVTAKVKEDSSLKFLDTINQKLNKFKKDFDLAPILKSIEEIQDVVAQMHDSVAFEFDESSKSLETSKKELTDLVKNSRDELSKLTAKELKTILERIDSLEDQLNTEYTTSNNRNQTLKEIIDNFDNRINEITEQASKFSGNYAARDKEVGSRFEESQASITRLSEELESLRKDTMSRLGSVGGGSMNRQINVNSSVMSSKYTDINFQQEGNIGWSVTDDDVNKRVNIRASILVGGGDSGTPGGNDTEIQFNDGGSFGGADNLTWNKNSSTLSLGAQSNEFQANIRGGTNKNLLSLTNSSVVSQFIFAVIGPNSTDVDSGKAFSFQVEGEANARGAFYTDGKYGVGPGSAGRDIFLSRPAGTTFRISNNAVLGGANLHVTSSIATGVVGSIKGAIVFNGRTSQNITIQPASTAGNWVMTLPPDNGTVNQVLTTDGNGITTWASVATGGVSRVVSILSVSSTLEASANTDYAFFPNVGVVLTLPTAISNTNRYTIKNRSSSSILVSATTGEDIDDATTALLTTQNESIDLLSNGSVWGII